MDITLLVVGTGSGLCHSLYSAVSKLLLKRRIPDPFLFLLWINVSQALLTPAVWLFFPPAWPTAGGWAPLLAAAGTCTAAYFFLYAALARGDVSSVMPMMGSKVVFSGLLARLMTGESHSGTIYLAAVLVALAVAALSYSPREKTGTVPTLPSRAGTVPGFSRSTLVPAALMLTACVIFAFTDIYIKRSLAHVDPYGFMVYYNGLVGVGSLLVIPKLLRGRSAAFAATQTSGPAGSSPSGRGYPEATGEGASCQGPAPQPPPAFPRRSWQALRIGRGSLLLAILAAAFLIAATTLFVVSFDLAGGVVVPNILMSTRGVFIVLISAAMTAHGQFALDRQGRWVYLLRLLASVAIIFSVWLALR